MKRHLKDHQHEIAHSVTKTLSEWLSEIPTPSLDSLYHVGITIGRGRILYGFLLWSSRGGAYATAAYADEEGYLVCRQLHPETLVTFHYK